MKRSARALELHMLDRAWTRYVNGNGAGLDWGRCLLMKWLRACISSSLGLSLSLDIGLLLKLNEYLKRRKAEKKREKTKTKWNQTKWNFCHGAIWRYKRCFSIESICRQKLFKFSNRHMCVQWVGQWWGRGGARRKTILKAVRHQQQHQHQQHQRHQHHHHHLRSLGLVIVFRTCDTIADDIANKDTKFNDLQHAGEEQEAGRSMAAEMLMSFTANAIALSLSLGLGDPLLFQRI